MTSRMRIKVGDTFIFDSNKVVGFTGKKKPPYEGQRLTIVGFRKGVNSVVVKEESGVESLMPSSIIEALMFK
jgi:hypothetical protein